MSLPKVIVLYTGGKENDQNFQEPQDMGSERPLIPGTQNILEAHSQYGRQVISGALVQVHITVGSVGPGTHTVVIS